MSFNRIKYDKSAYTLQMDRSKAPGDYRLFSSFAENCNQCLSYDGPVGSKSDVSLVKKPYDLSFDAMAEVESQLSWRNQKLEKTNTNVKLYNKNTVYHKTACDKRLTPEDTRFTTPIDNFRCMSLTGYQVEPYLHINPQCHVQESGDRIGMNSRLFMKDTYKVTITPADFLDKGEALPKQK
jgi:hypothetical protein